MEIDSSDILGGPMSLNARDSQLGWWSGLPLGAKSVFGLIVFFVLYVVGIRTREMYLVWREKAYKLSMRRRHGIPDTDHRPFNVAYAAVVRARQESEEKARKARLQELARDQQNALPDEGVRQRNGIPRNTSAMSSYNSLPGRYTSSDLMSSNHATGSNHAPTLVSQPANDYYNPNPAVRIAKLEINNNLPKSGISRRMPKFIDEGLKHGYDDESDGFELAKKRVIDDELDGDEGTDSIEDHRSRRGWKRSLGDDFDDENAIESKHNRDKRQRKISLDKSSQLLNEDMDVDDEEGDDIGALRSSVRGRKRDRAEAGSTFGGDEDNSSHEVDSEEARHHRKRRTYAKRKSDTGASSRGRKRDRDLGDDSEVENEATLKASRKKRGKRGSLAAQQDDRSDVSMDDSVASSARVGRPKRSIGDEWENNGVKYKVGPNGQRLRQTLVKKERQKFSMPEDSQHPDRQANLEVYVESWLTEEEYREAKDHQLLAWQDSSNKASVEPQSPTVESQHLKEELPSAGKNLLWKSTSNTGTSTPRQITPPPATPQAKQHLFGSSASTLGLRINPFGNAPSAGKRISSAVRRPSVIRPDGTSTVPPSPTGPIAHSLSDSTNNSPRYKTFSKWEKQDLEAKAMMKIREANRLKEDERLQKLKKEQEAAAPPQVVPTITVTKADDAKPAETKASTFSFGAPTSAAPEAPKKDAPSASNPLFGPPKASSQTPLFAPPPSQPTSKPPTAPAPVSTSASPQPTGSLFGSKPNQKSFVSFGPSSSSTPAPSTIVTSAPAPAPVNANLGIPTSKPSFSFGPLPGTQTQTSQAGEKKNEPASGASLLSRMGPAVPTAPPATQASQTPPAFGFGKPSTAEAPKSTSPFGNMSTPQPSAQPASAQPATESSGPKFSFGFGNKPAGGAPPTTSSSSSSLTGALGASEAPKPAASAFSFSKPATPASTDKGNATTASSTAPAANGSNGPKFNFGMPSSSGSNPFAVKTTITPVTNGTTTTPAQPTFGGFGAKPTGESSSSTPAPVPAPSAFGFGAKPVGESSSSTPAPAPAPSAFGFEAKPAGESSSSTSASAPTPSTFGFGAKPAGESSSSTPASAPTPSAFGFGAKPATNGSAPTQSVFGAQPTAGSSSTAAPSFSFGAKPSTSTSTSAPTQSAFGAPSSAASPAPTFGGFGTQPAAGTSSTTAPAPSVFGNGGAFGAKPNGDKPSAFGGFGGATTSAPSPFGGANNAFGGGAFGSKAPESSAAPAGAKDGTKPVFSFGAPAASSSTTPIGTPSATGATSAFGTTSAFGSTSNGTSAFGGFSFGDGGKNSAASQPTNSPFGKPAESTVFGGGNAFGGFGKTPASGQQQ
ncbi:hypothetical protein H0H87_000751 [Tephrocybe sp. NHM501043]|nr:hypothetical protein H0H87_000751 [Tephrocybe sp. NHM501043]